MCLQTPQCTDITVFKNYIAKYLFTIGKQKKECHLDGDFDDLLKYETSNERIDFLNSMIPLGYLPTILQD